MSVFRCGSGGIKRKGALFYSPDQMGTRRAGIAEKIAHILQVEILPTTSKHIRFMAARLRHMIPK